MGNDPGTRVGGDLPRAVVRVRVDDEDLVEQREALDHLLDRTLHDRADRLRLVEGRQDEADGRALLGLERGQPAQVAELRMVEVRLAEPAVDARRDRADRLGRPVGGGERLGPGGELVERGAGDLLAGLDDDDGRLRARRDRFGERAEQIRLAVGSEGLRRGAHHHEVRLLGFAQDRRPDVRRLAQERLAVAVQVLLHEGGQRVLRLGSHGGGDPRRDEVEDRHRRPVRAGDRVGETDRELGVRSAADRHEDPPDRRGAALLDDRDVARGIADDFVDRRREHRRPVAVAGVRRLAAPAEDHEVRLLLAGSLDDALGRPPADAHDGMDRRAFGREVEDALEEPAGVPRPRRALRQRHPLGHLDDPERGQLAALVEDRRAELDQLLGGERVGDRDQDPRGERRAAHARTSAWAFFAGFPVQRSTRYGFSSSNSRAWRSTRSSACSVVIERFSMTKLPTRPK